VVAATIVSVEVAAVIVEDGVEVLVETVTVVDKAETDTIPRHHVNDIIVAEVTDSVVVVIDMVVVVVVIGMVLVVVIGTVDHPRVLDMIVHLHPEVPCEAHHHHVVRIGTMIVHHLRHDSAVEVVDIQVHPHEALPLAGHRQENVLHTGVVTTETTLEGRLHGNLEVTEGEEEEVMEEVEIDTIHEMLALPRTTVATVVVIMVVVVVITEAEEVGVEVAEVVEVVMIDGKASTVMTVTGREVVVEEEVAEDSRLKTGNKNHITSAHNNNSKQQIS